MWHKHHVVTLGKQGRLVIPADIREVLGLSPGDRVHVRVDGPRIIMERPADAINELRALGREKAPNRSLVNELLAERRFTRSLAPTWSPRRWSVRLLARRILPR